MGRGRTTVHRGSFVAAARCQNAREFLSLSPWGWMLGVRCWMLDVSEVQRAGVRSPSDCTPGQTDQPLTPTLSPWGWMLGVRCWMLDVSEVQRAGVRGCSVLSIPRSWQLWRAAGSPPLPVLVSPGGSRSFSHGCVSAAGCGQSGPPPFRHQNKSAVRASTRKANVCAFFGEGINQQPIRFDMAIAGPAKISTQRVIPAFRRQPLAINQPFKHGLTEESAAYTTPEAAQAAPSPLGVGCWAFDVGCWMFPRFSGLG